MKKLNVIYVIMVIFMISYSVCFADANTYKLSNEEIYYTSDGNIITIPAYVIDKDLAICIEDLKNYGYTMKWDSKKRITSLTKKYINEKNMYKGITKRTISRDGKIISSDIKVYIEGKLVQAYNIGGYSLAKIKDINNITKQVRLIKYKPIDINKSENLYMVGFSYLGKMGFINKDFDLVIKPEYLPNSIHQEFDGHDIKCNIPIPLDSKKVNEYIEDVKGEKYLKIPITQDEKHNMSDNTISKFNYISKFTNGLAVVQIGGTGQGRICPAGGSKSFHNSYIKFGNVTKTGLWGIIDTNGNYVVEPKFEDLDNLHDGLAKVTINGKYGYINEKGELQVQPLYKYVNYLKDGYAVVKDEKDQYGIIDKKGNVTVPFGKFQCIFEYSNDGAFIVQAVNKKTNQDLYSFIDCNGNYIINKQFEDVRPFNNGIAAVKVNGKYGFINKKGEFIIKPTFAGAETYYNDFASIQYEEKDPNGNNTKSAYLNKDGYYINYQTPGFGATFSNSVYLWY